MNSATLLSLLLFAILQTATSEECTKFDVKIEDRKVLLNTLALCSCYGLGGAKPSPLETPEKTCKKNTTLNKKDGIVSISLEDLCGECETERINRDALAIASAIEVSSSIEPTETTARPPVSLSPSAVESELIKRNALANASATEVSSSIEPTEKTPSTPVSLAPSAVESELIKRDALANASATEVSSSIEPTETTARTPVSLAPSAVESAPSINTSHPAPEVSSDKPLGDATVSSSTSDKSKESSTTDASATRDKTVSSAHLSGEQSGTSFSGGAVFLFFLFGAVIGVLGVLAVMYIRKRYHSRSYETNNAPEQP